MPMYKPFKEKRQFTLHKDLDVSMYQVKQIGIDFNLELSTYGKVNVEEVITDMKNLFDNMLKEIETVYSNQPKY